MLPSSFDKQTGTFIFPVEEEELVVYASDLVGNTMQATFTTHMEALSPDGIPVVQNSDEIEAQNPLPFEAIQPENTEEFLSIQDTQPEEIDPAGNTEETASIYIHTKTP